MLMYLGVEDPEEARSEEKHAEEIATKQKENNYKITPSQKKSIEALCNTEEKRKKWKIL